MIDISDFGKTIHDIRKGKNLSLKQVAKNGDLSHPYISQIERGKRNTPKVDILRKLAKGLNVPYSMLLLKAGYLDDNFDDMSEDSAEIREKIQAKWENQPYQLNLEDISFTLNGGTEIFFHGNQLSRGQSLALSFIISEMADRFTDQDNPLSDDQDLNLTNYLDLLPEIMRLSSEDLQKLNTITRTFLK